VPKCEFCLLVLNISLTCLFLAAQCAALLPWQKGLDPASGNSPFGATSGGFGAGPGPFASASGDFGSAHRDSSGASNVSSRSPVGAASGAFGARPAPFGAASGGIGDAIGTLGAARGGFGAGPGAASGLFEAASRPRGLYDYYDIGRAPISGENGIRKKFDPESEPLLGIPRPQVGSGRSGDRPATNIRSINMMTTKTQSEVPRPWQKGGGGGGGGGAAFRVSLARSDVRGTFRFTGNVDKSQDRDSWEYGFVQAVQMLTPSRPYFEVKIVADAREVGIGLAGSSFSAGGMVGWSQFKSIGFHSDNGKLYGGPNKGTNLVFSSTSSKGDSIGCGINFDIAGQPETVFFTRNTKEVGRCEWRSKDLLFPVVTSASPAVVQVNLTATLPYDSASAKPANPKTSDELTTSANTSNSTLSAETTNFARYCSLLYGVSAQVMVNVFKASYQKEAGAPWDVKIAVSFVNDKITGLSHKKLGSLTVDKIRTGKCEDWDLTLLSSLLLFEPGYMKGISTARDAVEKLREARNYVAHHPHYQANQSIPKADFDQKWHIVSEALDVLIDQMSSKQQDASKRRIHEIKNEQIRQSDVEASGEMLKEDMKRIQDTADGAKQKAEEALEIVKSLKSVLNKDGRVDEKSLPREIVLSNDHRYRLFKLLGKGGMGAVYEAKLMPEGNKVALKICDPKSCPVRAQREAEILQGLTKLKHENIVRFIDSALEGSLLVIVMELIKGQSLDDWLDKKYADGNCVTLDQTKPIIQQLVCGVACVHSHETAHRDLKPSNLMFDEKTDKLVIVDFGLSKQHNTSSTMTKPNAQVGTLLYMSPEQLDGDVQAISFPSDVWAIGVIWHELLTNRTPFEPVMKSDQGSSARSSRARTFSRKDEAKIVNEVVKEGHRELPMLEKNKHVPGEITSTISKCLNADQSKRYRDATDLLRHIEGVHTLSTGLKTSGKQLFKDWDTKRVCKMLRDISPNFENSANAIQTASIDGECLMKMLDKNDELLTTKFKEGGLEFSKLQLRTVKSKIEALDLR